MTAELRPIPAAPRRIIGLAASVPLPVGQFFLGAGLPLAVLWSLTTKPREWPRYAKALAVVSAGSLVWVLFDAWAHELARPRDDVYSLVALTVYLIALNRMAPGLKQVADFLLFLCVGAVLAYAIHGVTHVETGLSAGQELWKYGIAFPVCVGVVGVLVRLRVAPVLVATVMLGLAVLGLAMDFRSQATVCLLAALVTFAKGSRQKQRGARLGILVGAGVLAVAAFAPSLISSGVFGQQAADRTNAQESASSGNVLLGGRTEMPLSLAAISADPVFGWGNSQAIDKDTIERGATLAARLGLDRDDFMPLWVREDGSISLHSIAFNATVQGGLLGAVLPLFLLALFVGGVFRSSGQYAPLVALVSVAASWDLLFSPWADGRGIFMAAYATLACWAISSASRARAVPPASVGVDQGATQGSVDTRTLVSSPAIVNEPSR